MSWQKLPLKVVAPPEASQQRFAPAQPVWNLTLDQIESHTGRIINKQLAPASEAGSSTYVFDSGNVLYSKLRPYLNKVIYPAEAGIATTELVPLRPKKTVVDAEYLTYYLRSNYFLKFAEQSVSGARMPRIMMTEFWEHLVPLPPLSEQRRIVEILDQADALRKKRAEADAKAERILPALFIKMFGDPATNPRGWKILKLEQVSKRITDGTHQPPQFVHEGVPFLFVQNIVNGYIDFNTQKYITEDTYAELTKRVRPERNDVLYSTVGSYGVAVRVDTDRKFSFQRHIGIIKLDHSQIEPWFLCAQLNMPHVKAQADQRVRGIAQKTLNLSELKQFCILVPPLAKQKQFTQLMTVISNMFQAAQRQSHLLNSSFDVLLQHAFSGDLTTKWREAHMTELSAEMEQQAKILGTTADSDYEQLSLTKMQ